MVVKVKICGITNLVDAQAAVEAGADALGFVFYKKGPRFIRPEIAAEIIKTLPKKIFTVGVFVDEKPALVRFIARKLKLKALQFHGSENPAYCAGFKEPFIIKAFRVNGPLDQLRMRQYKVSAYLLDAYHKRKFGGTGKVFDWGLAKGILELPKPVFLSGGLTPKNVGQAIRLLRPRWVDVSSGVEKGPGRKDSDKVRYFIAAARRFKASI